MPKRRKCAIKKPSLLMLNDDCLLRIMENLSMKDLMLLQRANKRIRDVCLLQLSRYTELNFANLFSKAITKKQFKHVVGFCSSSLRSLEVQIRGKLTVGNILNVIKNCANLKTIIISSEFSREFLSSRSSEPYWIDIDKVVCKNVKELHVSTMGCCLQDILVALPNLERLSCCALRFRTSDAARLPKNKLKSLQISHQPHLAKLVIDYVVAKLPELENFNFTIIVDPTDLQAWSGNEIGNFSSNKKLKEIHMNHWRLDDMELTTLGESIYGQLETLQFHGCYRVTEEGFRGFLKTQPNLKVVGVYSYFDDSHYYLLRSLDDYVRTRPKSDEPLTVNIDWDTDESKWSPLLNIVFIENRLDCATCIVEGRGR